MSGCGCNFTPGGKSPNVAQACAATSAPAGPCVAPSYSRACLLGDPRLSPLRIERQARAEHLWTRQFSFVIAAGSYSYFDVLFPAFTSAGSACLKSVSLTLSVVPAAGGPAVVTAYPVDIVGIAGVWDFTDATADWTERVAIPCEAATLDIMTTTGRCPCEVVCEGCLYPAGVGGLFMVRFRLAQPLVVPAGVTATITLSASGTHTPTCPCCVMPVYLNEPATVPGPVPRLQAFGVV